MAFDVGAVNSATTLPLHHPLMVYRTARRPRDFTMDYSFVGARPDQQMIDDN
jgi:hypothetical protein